MSDEAAPQAAPSTPSLQVDISRPLSSGSIPVQPSPLRPSFWSVAYARIMTLGTSGAIVYCMISGVFQKEDLKWALLALVLCAAGTDVIQAFGNRVIDRFGSGSKP